MRVTLYTRTGCHLCDEVRTRLNNLQARFPHRLVEVDIESDAGLEKLYLEKIPVLRIGAYTLQAPIGATELEVTLAAAERGYEPGPERKPAERRQLVRINRAVLFFARHWLAAFNLIVFLYVGMPVAAPTLMKLGAYQPARWIYAVYAPMCHQLAFRSFFLFGEQPVYPRAAADTQWMTFGQATGQSEDDFLNARRFTGDPRLGYKVALCERDVAIYGGILLAGLLFGLVRKRLPPAPIALWILLGIVPIALDGGSQLLSNLPFLPLTVRESTPFLRVLTGSMFGIMNVWLAYPYVEETMHETRAMIVSRLAGAAPVSAD
jgi:uncharacterized membrane protein